MPKKQGWIGVDLDGTLAQFTDYRGPTSIGEPLPAMVQRVQQALAAGYEVRIMTARVSHDGSDPEREEARLAAHAIRQWCEEHIGVELSVTNVKDYWALNVGLIGANYAINRFVAPRLSPRGRRALSVIQWSAIGWRGYAVAHNYRSGSR